MIITTMINTEIPNDQYKIVNSFYNSEYEKDANELCDAMNGYLINSHIVDKHRIKLAKHLKNKDYYKYYKLIKKIAKGCMEAHKEWN